MTTIEEYKKYFGDKGVLTCLYAYKCRLLYPAFDAIVLIRKMQKARFEISKQIISGRLLKKYSMEVATTAEIGDGFQIQHLSGIVIGAGTIIKENVTIYQGVTLGQKGGKYPVVGRNVVLYPGAKIIGGVEIGDNAVIGAGAVVLENIPENSIAVGVPAKIVKSIDERR